MSDEEFEAWVVQHCEATAAGTEAAGSLLAPATRRAFAEWGATAAELGEVTYRLISERRVPKFANEHAEAVASELLALRRERAAAERPDPAAAYPIGGAVAPGPECRWCRDTGLVTVPLYLCVEVPHNDPPRLVPYPGYRDVLTGSVLCDRPGCEPGYRVRGAEGKAARPRPTLTKYLQRFGGVNVVRLLEEHERAVVAHARRTAPKGVPDEYAPVIARLRARANGTFTEGDGK